MRKGLLQFVGRLSISIAFVSVLVSCSTLEQAIYPDEKPTWPSYEQIIKDSYKGPKARMMVLRFTDSAKASEASQVGDGMAEMLRNALLATNRYIIHSGKPLSDSPKNQDPTERIKKEEEIDLFVHGTVKEFKPGFAGAGEKTGGASYVTLMITVTDARTNKPINSRRMKAQASDSEALGRSGVLLPDAFKDFLRTPMEKAIDIAIQESASFIVAKTPPGSYRVLPPPPPPPKEAPKPLAQKAQPEITSPPQAPAAVPKPILRITQVVWANVNLRDGPGTNYRVIGSVKKGASLKIVETKGDWLRVRLEGAKDAWVNKNATSEAPVHDSSPPPPKPTPM